MPSDRFPIHSIASAPEASRPALEAARKSFGFLPNLIGEMAESPALVHAYSAVQREFTDRSSLTPAEQQVVLLTVSYLNGCRYCMAGHTALAQAAGLEPSHIEALRGGQPLSDPHLEALRGFTAAMVRERGWVRSDQIEALLAHGFTTRTVLDVIAGIAYKTMSNYTNHVAGTPLDKPLSKLAWHPPQSPAIEPLALQSETVAQVDEQRRLRLGVTR